MNTNASSFTKVCSSCGLKKPLSAFLELTGERHAGSYGNVCGTCRKTHLEKNRLKEADSGSRTETGHKIDSKAKIAIDIDNKEAAHRTEEEYYDEREEHEILDTQELEKKSHKEKGERKHRETFLDVRRNRSTKQTDKDAPQNTPSETKRKSTNASQARARTRREKKNRD